MTRKKILKLVHFGSTGWLGLSVVYMMIFALWQAGKSWWVIISLSGYSTIIGFLLVSLYLFAFFRGAARSHKIEKEHPLTASDYYLFFYDVCPIIGALAGWIGAIGLNGPRRYLLFGATGSLAATFLVWIIIDPAAGMLEMILPASRVNRRRRLAAVREEKEKEHAAKRELLAEVTANEDMEKVVRRETLWPYAERVAALAADGGCDDEDGERQMQAVDIGLAAWKMGGISCMRQLHLMAMEICRRNSGSAKVIDYISIWWDGIGNWRTRWPADKAG